MKTVYHSADKCQQPWNKTAYISKGAYGSIYQACCDTDCKYVIKEINLNLSYGDEEQFENEVKNHTKLAMKGISPKIYDAWINDKMGFIVMDRLRITLGQYLKINKHLPSHNLHKLFTIINNMHDNGIYHSDLHGSNIMMDEIDRFYIIDFGSSKFMETVTDDKAYNDYVDLLLLIEWDDVNRREILNYISKHFPNIVNIPELEKTLETIDKYRIYRKEYEKISTNIY